MSKRRKLGGRRGTGKGRRKIGSKKRHRQRALRHGQRWRSGRTAKKKRRVL